MDMSEIKEQMEIYTQWLNNAKSPEDKQMYTNMLNVWKAAEVKFGVDARAKRVKRLKAKVASLDVEFSVWENWAHSLYAIIKLDNDYLVKSHAKNWLNDVTWHVDSDLGAMEKVYQLVAYKIRDRKRERGDILKDLGLLKD